MDENWICPQCQSYNPQKRVQCWNCKTSQRKSTPAAPAERSKSLKPVFQHLQNNWWMWIAIGLILVIFGHILIQYFVDQDNYKAGHAAYQQIQCQTAIEYYNTLVEDWRLVNLGGFVELAKEELAECIPFQEADDLITQGDYDAALMAHYHFIQDFKHSDLTPHSQQRIELLFTSIAPPEIASQGTCANIDTFLEENLIPNTELVVPPVLFSCGKLYTDSGNDKDAYEFHKRLLVEYPNHKIATESESELLSNPISCGEIDSIEALSIIANRPEFMGSLYYHCVQAYYASGAYSKAFDLHLALLTKFPDHPMAGTIEEMFYRSPEYCDYLSNLDETAFTENANFLPKFYFSCSQAYQADREFKEAIILYTALVNRYPDHDLVNAVEESLISELAYCNFMDVLEESVLKVRPGLKPKFFQQCGDYQLANQHYDAAIRLFEKFLAEYPDHKKAPEIEISLAEAIVDRSKQGDSGEIQRPERSGTTAQSSATVTIQNDSPQHLRIVFSGLETRIEEMNACPTCEDFIGVGPAECPDKGPIQSYSLKPGVYEVVVEASSDSGVIPFTGTWELFGGDEYSSCFYIVKTLFP